jgi:hypothetical protein
VIAVLLDVGIGGAAARPDEREVALRSARQEEGDRAGVDEFVAPRAADNRINKFFAATAADPARLSSSRATWSIRSARRAVAPASTRART